MKKLNTTYLDNLVSKILKETLEERADDIVSKIKSESNNGQVCECGGQMYEGECNECGNMYEDMSEGIYDVEDLNNSDEFDYVQEDMVLGDSDKEELDSNNTEACKYHMDNFGPEDERTLKFCGSDVNESLKGRQKRLDKNKNNKIDAEDFKMLRQGKKSETDEGIGEYENIGADDFHQRTGGVYDYLSKKDDLNSPEDEGDEEDIDFKEKKPSFFDRLFRKKRDMEEQETQEGDAFGYTVKKAKEAGEKEFEFKGKKYPVKESYRLTESELVSMIEKIVKEQKMTEVEKPKESKLKPIGGTPKGYSAYEKAHKGSGKENDDYIKDVTKKMKDYLKDGSKGDYNMNPKMFPVGNGELEEMDKMAFEMTDDLEDFNYEIGGLQLPTPDAVEFNEDFMEKLYKGDSTTGNAPGGNALESKANDRFDKLRKKNTLKKLKDQSYNRVSQPVYNEKSGTEKGKGISIKLESVEDKKTKQINEEFNRMKSLIGYDRKTQ
jgi:hypothetical protein